jgi:hypothetical protein
MLILKKKWPVMEKYDWRAKGYDPMVIHWGEGT